MNDQKELFQLAKSLNAVETIKVSSGAISSHQHPSSHHSTQTFRYIIVIDFEATCWAKDDQKWKKNEIIEFPAVLINLTNGKIESEFRQYVMPIENPRLSDFCTELTGIRQDQVDDGVPLHTCLSLFNKWMKQTVDDHMLILPKSNPDNQTGNVALATWSDWDFGTCLSKECTRKKINKPAYFDQWIDVRAIYKKFYQHNPISFNDALNKLGMQFAGRPHSGLDDSRNIARLITKMCLDGANFVITKDLKPFELFNK
ncbi:3'-5' exonuclease Snipper [Ochlerotatus camptorhynchus]|uniref:3'-5' exonuclease Snipper n=1 Tax=Ochlerotatus camptorhynchus TaxID=644619 RepID=UPI0031E02452